MPSFHFALTRTPYTPAIHKFFCLFKDNYSVKNEDCTAYRFVMGSYELIVDVIKPAQLAMTNR